MGKWEERFFRLDYDSLKFFGQNRKDMLGEFALDQIENMSMEATELTFMCQGRKNRMRANNDGMIREWYSKLQSYIAKGPNPNTGFQDTPSPMKAQQRQVASPQAPAQASPVQGGGNKSRVDMMYEAHQRKLDKLQDQRDKEAEDEKKRLQDEWQKNMGKTQKNRGPPVKITQNDVSNTADRLFNEHKINKQRLDQKRQAWEAKEDERIADTKRMNLPTRTNSDPGLLTAREAGDRLYSDAERRELWRTQARDAQAKDELTMVRVGAKGTSASSLNRCNDLHKEAVARKDKLDKARVKKDKEEAEALTKGAVPCGDGRRGANLARLDLLYQEHKERAKKVAQSHSEAVMRETKEIEKHQVAPRLNKRKVPLARRQPPPWKDPNYPFNLPKKGKEQVKDPALDHPPKPPTSHADYGLVAVQAAVAQRCGYNQYSVRAVDYQLLVSCLRKIMKCYRDAHRLIQQDAGFASACSRASQRLFQEHLLPEVEGWSHRLNQILSDKWKMISRPCLVLQQRHKRRSKKTSHLAYHGLAEPCDHTRQVCQLRSGRMTLGRRLGHLQKQRRL